MRSFRDSKTAVLKSWGFVDGNESDDISKEEDASFCLEPGKWKFVRGKWKEIPPDQIPGSE